MRSICARIVARTTITIALAMPMGLCAFAVATPVPYDFVLQPTSGATFTNVSLTANTSGTLIGNWDPVDNPTGTRTKPGLFGTFGDTENLPVNTSITFAATGAPHLPLGGGFGMQLDTSANTLLLTNYASALSGAATGGLDLGATILFESFRTRQPTSTFPGGIPVTIPLGEATITALSIEQADPGAPGVLTPVATDQYSFVVSPLVNISGMIDLQGSATPFGPIATVLPLQGTITLSGDNATLTSLAPLDLSDTQMPNLALPPIPFDLPTVLPAGDVAHVVFHLTLDQVTTVLQGTLTTHASGAVVPEPVHVGGITALLCALGSRRRRDPAAWSARTASGIDSSRNGNTRSTIFPPPQPLERNSGICWICPARSTHAIVVDPSASSVSPRFSS